jgi:hypothetical protein
MDRTDMPPGRFAIPSLSALATAALLILVAGCGGGRSPGVANIASSTTTAATSGGAPNALMVAFTSCMRSHGVPSFPDPEPTGPHSFKLTLNPSGQGPEFQAALGVCHHLLPAGQTTQEQPTQLSHLLSFAKCMRSHRMPRFPDPSAQGGLPLAMVQAQGINVHSRSFLKSVKACLPMAHGTLTAAGAEQAIHNASG